MNRYKLAVVLCIPVALGVHLYNLVSTRRSLRRLREIKRHNNRIIAGASFPANPNETKPATSGPDLMSQAQKFGEVKSIRLKKELLEVHVRLTGEKLTKLLENLDKTYRLVRLDLENTPRQPEKLDARLAVSKE